MEWAQRYQAAATHGKSGVLANIAEPAWESRAQQLKGRVHPVEQSNTDDAEQQDGKGE
jgi:hypothetical protein